MLLELNIENYAIIEDMKINFQKGLNVITGETGSGKSIIIDALGMVLGGRANKDVIKAGKDFCYIEAIFTTYDKDIKDLLESMGIEVDDYLIITKDISKNGPSITRINNRVITSSNLLKIIPKIIDVFAQHESISLMNHDNQRNLLDDFCDNKHKENLLLLKNLVHEINELKKDYENKLDSSTNKDREIDILNYQINEINEANLTSYDDKELEEDYFRPYFDSIKEIIKDKKLAIFGSYEWNSGEWMDLWKKECEDDGIAVIDALIAYDHPDADALAKCRELAEKLMK